MSDNTSRFVVEFATPPTSENLPDVVVFTENLVYPVAKQRELLRQMLEGAIK